MLEEFKLIIRFVMVAASNSSDEKEAEIKEFFRFLNEKMDILLILGLRINMTKEVVLEIEKKNMKEKMEMLSQENENQINYVK